MSFLISKLVKPHELALTSNCQNMLSGQVMNWPPKSLGHSINIITGQPITLPARSMADFSAELVNVSLVFPDILLLTGNEVLDFNNGHTSGELISHDVPYFPAYKDASGSFRLKVPEKFVRFPEQCAFITALPNYSAVILGEITRLKDLPGLERLVIHGESSPWMRRLLELTGFEGRVVSVPETVGIQFDSLIYSSPKYFHHSVPPSASDFLRNFNVKAERKTGSRIYLSRRGLGERHDRRIQNEDEVENFLVTKGFEILFPERLSVDDQLAAFRNAEVVVAPFGAAWANSCFLRSATRCLMLGTKFSPEFHRIAYTGGVNIDYLPLSGFKVRPESNFSRSHEFRVSGKEFTAIENWLNAI